MTDIPTEALEAARLALEPWRIRAWANSGAGDWLSGAARDAIAAAAPHLIAEGRRQAIEAIRARSRDVAQAAADVVGLAKAPPDHPFVLGCEWAARIAEGGTQ